MFALFDLIDKEKIKLINSAVIEYENSKNPFPNRKIWISQFLQKSSYYQKAGELTKKTAENIEKYAIQQNRAVYCRLRHGLRRLMPYIWLALNRLKPISLLLAIMVS